MSIPIGEIVSFIHNSSLIEIDSNASIFPAQTFGDLGSAEVGDNWSEVVQVLERSLIDRHNNNKEVAVKLFSYLWGSQLPGFYAQFAASRGVEVGQKTPPDVQHLFQHVNPEKGDVYKGLTPTLRGTPPAITAASIYSPHITVVSGEELPEIARTGSQDTQHFPGYIMAWYSYEFSGTKIANEKGKKGEERRRPFAGKAMVVDIYHVYSYQVDDNYPAIRAGRIQRAIPIDVYTKPDDFNAQNVFPLLQLEDTICSLRELINRHSTYVVSVNGLLIPIDTAHFG